MASTATASDHFANATAPPAETYVPRVVLRPPEEVGPPLPPRNSRSANYWRGIRAGRNFIQRTFLGRGEVWQSNGANQSYSN